MNDPHSPTIWKTHLCVSKRNQFRKGVNVNVGNVNSRHCSVTAVVAYMAICGHNPGPFFLTWQGKPLTKPRFIAEVWKGLAKEGLDQATFAGHSFCIGDATVAAQAGVPDSGFQVLRKWNSTAFLSYISTPCQQLASFTSSFM